MITLICYFLYVMFLESSTTVIIVSYVYRTWKNTFEINKTIKNDASNIIFSFENHSIYQSKIGVY